jgi:hypothetical protein
VFVEADRTSRRKSDRRAGDQRVLVIPERLPPYYDPAKDATVSDRQLEQTAADPEP